MDELGIEWSNSPWKRWGRWAKTTSKDLNQVWYRRSKERGRVVVAKKDLKTFLNPEASLTKTFTFVNDLGQGDMSVGVSLWRGHSDGLFAVKKFSSHNDSAATDHEFRIGLDLNHMNIARTFHCVRKHEKKTYFDYLVMEYVDGQTISDWLKTHDVSGTLIKQAKNALGHMGKCRAWPADLNGRNLMVTYQQKLKFIDLGFYYRPDDEHSTPSSSEEEGSQDNIITVNLRSGKADGDDVAGGHL